MIFFSPFICLAFLLFLFYSELSLNAAASLLATEWFRLNWILSDLSDISVKAATALATTFYHKINKINQTNLLYLLLDLDQPTNL